VNAAEFVGTNCAVNECAPAASADVVTAADPATSGCVAPTWVSPSKNNTVPAGVPDVAPTVAVKVTDVPATCGDVGATARVVVVATAAGLVTTNVDTLEVDPANAAAFVGMNCAVSGCEPTASADVVTAAEPATNVCVVPIWVTPSKNLTVPAGVPDVAPTVAVNVTGLPATCGDAGATANVVVVATGAALIV
jgi:hypothetical protein